MLGMMPRALHRAGECTTAKLHPKPFISSFQPESLPTLMQERLEKEQAQKI
jgi:hypothetical protein